MTKTEVYAEVYDHLTIAEGVDVDKILSTWKRGTKVDMPGSVPALLNLMAELREDIRTEAASRAGLGGALRAARAIMKTARKGMKGAFTDKSGKQCFCDGFRLLRLNTPLDFPALPAPPLDTEPVMADQRIAEPIELPPVGEIKGFLAVAEADAKAKFAGNWRPNVAPLRLAEGGPAVNARYLLDILAALPDAEASCLRRKGALSPVYFTSAAGDAVLLPVRAPKKTAETAGD